MSQSSLLPRFNIAAVPVDADVREGFFLAAQNLKPYADSYCLEPQKTLPHVTLCQFRAADEKHAAHLVDGLLGEEIVLRNTGLFTMVEKVGQENVFWTSYVVERAKRLMDVQAGIVEALRATAPEIFNQKGDRYFPHFTLVRSKHFTLPFNERAILSPRLVNNDIGCRIRLGLSDEMGQFLKTLDGPL